MLRLRMKEIPQFEDKRATSIRDHQWSGQGIKQIVGERDGQKRANSIMNSGRGREGDGTSQDQSHGEASTTV